MDGTTIRYQRRRPDAGESFTGNATLGLLQLLYGNQDGSTQNPPSRLVDADESDRLLCDRVQVVTLGRSIYRTALRQTLFVLGRCIPLLLVAAPASSQQVRQLEIHRSLEEIGQQGSTRVEVHLPLDLEGLNLDEPIDKDATRVTSFADDQGLDLLLQHRKVQQSNVDRGHDWITALRFVGIADRRNNRDVKLSITSSDAPSPAASRLTISADVVFNYADEVERSSVVVEQFPVPDRSGRSRLDSALGPVSAELAGLAQLNDTEWRRFAVTVPGISILDVEVIGGDDSASMPFAPGDASAGEFVISDGRESVDIEITFAGHRKVNFPLNLEFGIGL